MQQHLFEDFQNPGHTSFIEDVSITLIDKTDPSIPTKCEDYLSPIILKTLKTLHYMVLTLKKVYSVSDYIWYFYLDFSL